MLATVSLFLILSRFDVGPSLNKFGIVMPRDKAKINRNTLAKMNNNNNNNVQMPINTINI